MEKAAWNTDIVFFPAVFSICQNKLRENGWYHILSGQTDSISREPIVTTKDFIALKLDTDYFGKYVISGQISNYKRKNGLRKRERQQAGR